MSSLKKKLLFGAIISITGLLLVLVPQTRFLEQDLGLSILFKLRGEKQPPPEVLIVTLDKYSAAQLNLPARPENWPRSLHAELVNSLTEQGVKTIAFDLHFREPDSGENDGLLAGAIQQAKNVVLCECLSTEKMQAGDFVVQVEKPVPPVKILQNSAAAVAPFPLPKFPLKVAQYWTFKSSAGDTPTLPVIAFQLFAAGYYEDFIALLKKIAPEDMKKLPARSENLLATGRLIPTVRSIRNIFGQDQSLASRMLREVSSSPRLAGDELGQQIFKSLILMYQGPENPFLNYYGPPGTIATLPYYQALKREPGFSKDTEKSHLQGKAVFVGLSATLRPEQQDGFYTVFSKDPGVDISGVEIAATAFANILQGSHVKPLSSVPMLGIVFFWGLLAALICSPSRPFRCFLGGFALCAVYAAGAQQMFTVHNLWLPLVIPVCIQIPLALIWVVLWSLREVRQEKHSLSRALEKYLPPEIADKLAKEKKEAGNTSQGVYGICLMTDAGSYTTLSEQLSPVELHAFMKSYYEILFTPVKENSGTIINIVGDSMLALWSSSTPDISIKKKACLAALNIPALTSCLHPSFPDITLTTRIGLHAGDIVVGDIGALDHFEYRPCGDIVNTASRLEGLNKHLGTHILVSAEVLHQLDGFVFRRLGEFRLAGKSKSLTVFELICPLESASERTKDVCEVFQAGLQAFEQQHFSQAAACFTKALQASPNDGPSQFYCRLCKKYDQKSKDDMWDGVICFENK